MQEARDRQHQHWESYLATHPDTFGEAPSYPALRAAQLFQENGTKTVLELGAGQGRDTLFFAGEGFTVQTVDYSQAGLDAIAERARRRGLANLITPTHHDVRKPLPFADASFDACFSHMLYNMALTAAELEALCSEIRRVLRTGGLNVFTARNTSDPHFRQGIWRGKGMWETGGFVVHFLSREDVERLATGYELQSVEEFEEGRLPRRLWLVVLRKPSGPATRSP